MTTVYRVQDQEGRGPFKPGFSDRWCEHRLRPDMAPLLGKALEVHRRKMIKRNLRHWGYACKSLEQLGLWFNQTETDRLRPAS